MTSPLEEHIAAVLADQDKPQPAMGFVEAPIRLDVSQLPSKGTGGNG